MTRIRSSLLKALLPLSALLGIASFGACVDPVIIGGSGAACNADSDCTPGLVCLNGTCQQQPGTNPEICNGIDDDNDGTIDDGALCSDGSVCVNGQCGGTTTQCDAMHPCPPNSTCSSAGFCVPVCDPAQPEVCDGQDNDCDGNVDNPVPGTAICPNGGACVMGQCNAVPCMSNMDCPSNQQCVNGVCIGGCIPQPEQCNGVDDNCNGIADEMVVCADGSLCVNGQCGGMCTPKSEICDGIDNNCNGQVDEATTGALLCPNGGQCVNGMCAVTGCMTDSDCPMGQICDPATATCHAPNCMPAPEACNGVDDDCDGQIDDGAQCTNGAVCVNGQCGGMCVPKNEVCNALDDDCDGVIDDPTPGATLCPMGGQCVMGQCVAQQCMTNMDCPTGQICTPNKVCSPGACMPTLEKCDGIDNDCDGSVDEQTPGTTLCGQGKVCLNGNCSIKQCNSTMDCPTGTSCVGGLCQ